MTELTQCPTCTRSKYDPFRGYDQQGRIANDCIDDFHTGHLTPISSGNEFHNRREAKQWRAAVKKHVKLVVGKAIHDYRNCQCFAKLRGQ